jgi:hypothetical protein
MAKKVVASMKSDVGKSFTRVIKIVKSPKTGAYAFKDEVMHNEVIKEYLAGGK